MKDFLIANCDLILITAFGWLTAYLTMILTKFYGLRSISESDARLKRPWGWLFEATMFISGIAIISAGLALDNIGVIAGGGFICMVGVFTDYKSNIHIFFASMGYAVSTFALLWEPVRWMVPVAVGIVLITYFNSKKYDEKRITINVEIAWAISLMILLYSAIRLVLQ